FTRGPATPRLGPAVFSQAICKAGAMVILLVGASGLLGGALQGALSHRRIRQLVRRPPHPQDAVETVQWAPPAPPPLTVFDGVSAVVNLGGAGVGDKRWTRRRLQVIRSSRTGPTHALAHARSEERRVGKSAANTRGPRHDVQGRL